MGEILGEVRFVVPAPLIGELKHLDNKHAKAALALARSREIVPTDARGDDAVIDIALKENGYILTNDKALRRRARTQRIPLLYLRSGTHLVEETYRAVGRLKPIASTARSATGLATIPIFRPSLQVSTSCGGGNRSIICGMTNAAYRCQDGIYVLPPDGSGPSMLNRTAGSARP